MARADPAAAAAGEVAGRLGAPVRRLRRHREGSTNSVWSLDSPAVVLIVAPARSVRADVAARATRASVLARLAPVVRPVAGLEQPQEAAGRLVTVWERVPVRPGPPDWTALGAAVRRLHDVDPRALPGAPLRDADSFGPDRATVAALRAGGRLRAADARVLLAVIDRLEGGLTAATGASAARTRALLHGDLHAPNLLPTADGVVLCDLDELAVGHPDLDLGALVDPGRAAVPPGPARDRFQEGYGGPLPTLERARSAARTGHLRLTLDRLARPRGGLSERYYDRLRLASWAQTLQDWSLELHPVVQQRRSAQFGRVLRPAGRL